MIEWVEELADWTLKIAMRGDDIKRFEVMPHRWGDERTFGWLSRCRRMVCEYEVLTSTSEAWIKFATTRSMLRRLTASYFFCMLSESSTNRQSVHYEQSLLCPVRSESTPHTYKNYNILLAGLRHSLARVHMKRGNDQPVKSCPE